MFDMIPNTHLYRKSFSNNMERFAKIDNSWIYTSARKDAKTEKLKQFAKMKNVISNQKQNLKGESPEKSIGGVLQNCVLKHSQYSK